MLLRAVALLVVLVLAGCTGGRTTNIDVQDSSIVLPAARVAIDFGERPGPPSRLHTSHAVELGVSAAKGSDTLNIAPAQGPVVFGGERFTAPQELRAEFDFRFIEAAYRYRWFSERRGLGFEALAGLAHAQLGLRLFGATQIAAERLEGTGVVVSAGTMFRLWPSGSLQLRGSGFASTTSEGVSSVGRYEVAFEQEIGRQASLRAGYAGWDIRSRREHDDLSASNRSPIRVRANGPMIGLILAF